MTRAGLIPMDSPNNEEPGIDHVLVTRFNLPTAGSESLIRAQDGWLQDRVELFERYTVPSVRAQSTNRFRWIVYFDPESPDWLIERLAPLVADGVFAPLYRETVAWHDVATDAREITGGRRVMLLTTNLDNDDAIAIDFVERLQHMVRVGKREALYLGTGLILSGGTAFLRFDPENAFCSVAEPWDGAVTAWRDWHNLLHNHMTLRIERGRPAWLQVVHGRNVSNRVRGHLVDPSEYRRLFPGLLDHMSIPGFAELLIDRGIRVPLREVRETGRRAAKTAVLRLSGRDGLDRVKQFLQSSQQ